MANQAVNPESVEATAQRVASNARAIRKARGLDLADVSDRLERLKRPIGVNALSKIELGKRRVDADDLVALSLALDTSPIRLLLPPDADEETIRLTAAVRVTSRTAWRWAVGEEPLWGLWDDAEPGADLDRFYQYRAESRPHEAEGTTTEMLVEHKGVLSEVAAAARQARQEGLPLSAIKSYLDLLDSARQLIAAVGVAREAREQQEEDEGAGP